MRENGNMLSAQDILQCIKEEGYFPVVEDSGEVRFKVNGTLLVVSGMDGGCVSIRVYYELDSGASEAAVKAANEIMGRYLLVRPVVSADGDRIVFCVDSFCSDVDAFRKMLPESIVLLGEAIESHHTLMESMIAKDVRRGLTLENLLGAMQNGANKS